MIKSLGCVVTSKAFAFPKFLNDFMLRKYIRCYSYVNILNPNPIIEQCNLKKD